MKPELVIITRQHMRNKKGGKESVSSLSCFQQLNTLVTIPGQQSHIILRRFRYKLLNLHHFHESLMLLPIGWWYQLTIYGKRSKQTWSCRELLKLCEWLNWNKLSLNVSKYNFVIYHPYQRKLYRNVNLYGVQQWPK